MTKNLREVALIHHNYVRNCAGMIISDETGTLRCSVCGMMAGRIDPEVLEQLIELLEQSVTTSAPGERGRAGR